MPENLLKEGFMSQDEKMCILKNYVGILSKIETEIRQKIQDATQGVSTNNANLIIGSLNGMETLGAHIKSICDMMVFVHRI